MERNFGLLGATESFASEEKYGWMVVVLPLPAVPDNHSSIKVGTDGTVLGIRIAFGREPEP